LVELLACERVSREPESESGPEKERVFTAPVPLPTRTPESVVDPVPPTATPSVELETSDVPSYQMGRPDVKEEAFVPPRAIESLPVHSGVKVKALPLFEMVSRRLASEEVANVMAPV